MLVGRKNSEPRWQCFHPEASMQAFLGPHELVHTFSVEITSSECFMLLLLNHNNRNNGHNSDNSDESSAEILEVLEQREGDCPPQKSNV